ncbi:GNAT family N-acetyltransferase [Algoriphagus sp. H41]|uniref:GNAT family N-acetyltransferase n=1 Tax=Algoriphagus oliviformis TaxID=2811231 RepID=A0ABS3C252_9BACT|nr:GNAT family protein [Algoriphagus oliviformis]MBN7811189.1 GNAT family N-acetyltransferase [Algoriphagus oliviformis]
MDFSFDKELVLENEAVLLRPLRESDLDALLPIATQDPQLLRYSLAPIHSRELLTTYLQKAAENRRNKIRYSLIVFDKRANAYAGVTCLLSISNPDERLEIGGTWYGRDFHRTGLNRHCKFLLLDYAFGYLGAKRVEFKTDERNTVSRTAIQKIGGQQEGILRNHTLLYDGFRRNTVYYSILDCEWQAIRDRFAGWGIGK